MAIEAPARVPWTAVITVTIIVLGFLLSIGTGLISVGTNTAQIVINTAELIRIRSELAKLQEEGSPGLQEIKVRLLRAEEEVKTRLERHDALLNALPVKDSELSGRLLSNEGRIERLDAETVKKTNEWPLALERIARLETSLADARNRAEHVRDDINAHRDNDDKREAARMLMLEETLRTERLRNSTVGPGTR